MATHYFLNLIRSCGLVLALGMTVQGSEFVLQLNESVEELTDEVSTLTDFDDVGSTKILQTGLFEDLGVTSSQSACCGSACGSSCESSCCSTGCGSFVAMDAVAQKSF